MKKILVLILTVSMLFVGCGKENTASGNESTNGQIQVEKIDNNQNEVTTGIVDETDTSETDNVVDGKVFNIIGEITQFDEDSIHVLQGDFEGIYKVDPSIMQNFYLGQTVELIEAGDMFTVKTFVLEDFSVPFEDMGYRVLEIAGKVIAIDEKNITIENEDGEHTYKSYHPMFAEVGNEVLLDVIVTGEEEFLHELYNITNKITVNVMAIDRNDEGYMVLSCGDGNEVTHIAMIDYTTIVNFNYQDLAVGDQLDLYAEVMSMSYPAQLMTKRAMRIEE